ncbi:MAG: sigma 54-interacting transcriptional regulator [Deltaproteobacteria bacterium]|nr:sigma 54-interacting transcriptional regulator [Deltaproteobacteria bacterium]
MSFRFPGVSGASPRMREALNLMELVAPSDATVLLLGETGTGKELAAQAIHLNSPRRGGPFVVVNCAAIPENLLESELFGHERGAFTGATGKKDGRFLLAHRGTLFLDEIGEFSPALQAKILRVLQTREFEPLGSNRTLKADVRIIAATNRDLEVMVRDGRFREDLYYRLNVFPITLPPLRDRVEDLPQLAEFFLHRFRDKHRRPVQSLAPEVLQAFRNYPWPGNIRELENVIERGVIMCQTDTLTLKELPLALQSCAVAMPGEEAGEPTLMELERQLILRTLEKMSRNRQQAAEVLGISLDELNLKIRAYGLEI